jgi:hypothetical protein
MALTDTQRIAIAALARAILRANLPEVVEQAMFGAFGQWPEGDCSQVHDLVKREVGCFVQVRRK